MVRHNHFTAIVILNYILVVVSHLRVPFVEAFVSPKRIQNPDNIPFAAPSFAPSTKPTMVFFSSKASESEKASNEPKTNRKKRALYSFPEARKIARGHGFSTKEEFIEYDCPGAYQLPKNANDVWADEWTSWEDFLGLPINDFEEARNIARAFARTSKISTEEEYLDFFRTQEFQVGDIASRLPFRPDLKYKTKGWVSWDDFLSAGSQ